MTKRQHEWESRGDHVAFFIVRRSGERLTVLIDLQDADRVLALRWCSRWDDDTQSYYVAHHMVAPKRTSIQERQEAEFRTVP